MGILRTLLIIVLWIMAVSQLYTIGANPSTINQRIPILLIVLLILFLMHVVFKSEE